MQFASVLMPLLVMFVAMHSVIADAALGACGLHFDFINIQKIVKLW